MKAKELYIKKPPEAMPAKSKGDDSRKCIQVLNGEKHSPYSAPNKSEQCHCCSTAQALQTLMRQADYQRKDMGDIQQEQASPWN